MEYCQKPELATKYHNLATFKYSENVFIRKHLFPDKRAFTIYLYIFQIGRSNLVSLYAIQKCNCLLNHKVQLLMYCISFKLPKSTYKIETYLIFISAAGLYYIAELIEEYTVLTCRVIRVLILVMFKNLCQMDSVMPHLDQAPNFDIFLLFILKTNMKKLYVYQRLRELQSQVYLVFSNQGYTFIQYFILANNLVMYNTVQIMYIIL